VGHGLHIVQKYSYCLLLTDPVVSELAGKPETLVVAIALSGTRYCLIQPLLPRWGREAQIVRYAW